MQVISLIYKVPFPRITADTLMFVLQRTNNPILKTSVEIGEYGKESLQIPQLQFEQDPAYSFQYYESVDIMNLTRKLECSSDTELLSSLCDTTSGFGGKSELITDKRISSSQIETIKGDSIGRYTIKKTYWFEFKEQNITGRTTNRAKLGSKPKLLLRKTGDRILATFDDSGTFPEQSLYFLFNNRSNIKFKYMLGILNSSSVTFYYRARLVTNKQSIAQLKKIHLDAIPIPNIKFSNPTDKARHDRMVTLVNQMLSLYKKLAAAKVNHTKMTIQRQIESTDYQIDRLVYELYGLTEKEIEIVEEGMQ